MCEREYILNHCWLINFDGKCDTFLPIDMAQEHNIRDIKDTYCPAGPNSDWAYLKKISPAIPAIKAIAAHVKFQSGAITRGRKHKSPNAYKDIQLLERSYIESEVHVNTIGHVFNDKKARKDLLMEGMKDVQVNKVPEKWNLNRNYKRLRTEMWDLEVQNDAEMVMVHEEEDGVAVDGAVEASHDDMTMEIEE